MSLFQRGEFVLHSGEATWWKANCEALSYADWHTLARLLVERLPPFGLVEGVPTGGTLLAFLLAPHATKGPLLICDDVFTTGRSLEQHRAGRTALGAVLFARNPVPSWVTALWTLHPGTPPAVGLTPAEREVARDLFAKASERMGNSSCNDYSLADTPANRELLASMWRWAGEPQRAASLLAQPVDTSLGGYDWLLFDYLTHKLLGDAHEPDRGAAEGAGCAG